MQYQLQLWNSWTRDAKSQNLECLFESDDMSTLLHIAAMGSNVNYCVRFYSENQEGFYK